MKIKSGFLGLFSVLTSSCILLQFHGPAQNALLVALISWEQKCRLSGADLAQQGLPRNSARHVCRWFFSQRRWLFLGPTAGTPLLQDQQKQCAFLLFLLSLLIWISWHIHISSLQLLWTLCPYVSLRLDFLPAFFYMASSPQPQTKWQGLWLHQKI